MPSDIQKSVIRPLQDVVGDKIEDVYREQGYTDADDRVWHSAARSDTPYPYTVFNARESRSLLAANKDDDPAQANVTVRVHGKNDVTVETIGAGIQEKLIDADEGPDIDGFHLLKFDLVFHEPLNEIREDAPNIYGRVLEVEYHFNPL